LTFSNSSHVQLKSKDQVTEVFCTSYEVLLKVELLVILEDEYRILSFQNVDLAFESIVSAGRVVHVTVAFGFLIVLKLIL
jgi:hypothetical protein